MYLKCHKRFKDGKEHRYWSIVESVRTRRGVIKANGGQPFIIHFTMVIVCAMLPASM